MTKTADERELVLGILIEVTRDQVMSHVALRGVLEKYQYLDKRERAFITRLSEGTIERMLELDYIIDRFSSVKKGKMKPVIRNILRMAVYQIKYMDSVPDSAACNEAVRLAVKKGFGPLRGFVNGVLRRIAREKENLPLPDPSERTAYLSVRYSVPAWIVEQWRQEYGEERTEDILNALYRERPTCIWCGKKGPEREALIKEMEEAGITVRPHPEGQGVLCISGYDYLGTVPGFREGAFLVQDISSARAVEAGDIRKGDHVLDICGAPGGKALHAAWLLEGTGSVETRDVSPAKMALIQENIDRMGIPGIRAVCQDATVFDEASVETADVLLADLPCSGLGVLAKKTDLKYRMNPGQEEELVQLQRKILSTVKDYVKPGGTLLYSTCTVHRAENEENADWFRKEFPEFSLEWQEQIFPSASRETDGFYLAKFKKRQA